GAAETERTGGAEQELVQLRRPLAVAPVADPDEVTGGLATEQRPEAPDVGRLVPGPRCSRPLPIDVDPADDLAVGEHAVVVAQVIARHLAGLGDRAVVCVV